MKKIDYKKPNMCVVELQHRTHLMDPSTVDPGGAQKYVREYSGDSDEGSSSSGGSVWDKEW